MVRYLVAVWVEHITLYASNTLEEGEDNTPKDRFEIRFTVKAAQMWVLHEEMNDFQLHSGCFRFLLREVAKQLM